MYKIKINKYWLGGWNEGETYFNDNKVYRPEYASREVDALEFGDDYLDISIKRLRILQRMGAEINFGIKKL